MRGSQKSDLSKALARSALTALLVLIPLAAVGLTSSAAPQDEETSAELRAARGRTTYRLYCRNCHGVEGLGDGAIADLLKVPPSDLTVLSRDNAGNFPADHVYETIDGRISVRAHGSREMPIWGFSFQDPGRSEDQEDEVRERILDLVEFVRTLQADSE